ncbi:unnamed protein product [Mytilus edulis]|uniref:Uncharacterized protein n=1 Tax=Mytilus edulis TaxID=6550 RepID=A0A8S3Q5C3_MYTED|nr:unnamed protein product [Mytilus edulis]
MQSRGFTVELSSKKDVRLDHNLSIEEFNRAFRKYRNIMGKAFPQRKVELEQYESDINEISQNYGPCFYTYHKMFSAKAAAAIVEHNIVINWSKVDDKLLNLVTHLFKAEHVLTAGNLTTHQNFVKRQNTAIQLYPKGLQIFVTQIRGTDRFLILQGQNSAITTITALAIEENANSCTHVVNVGQAGMA